MSKFDKKLRIFQEGFKLFNKKGTENTSIQEIVDNAGVAKGTFYLYFKDKYDLREQLITKKSYDLFNEAVKKLDKKKIEKFDEQIIFIIDYIIDKLKKNKNLLKFITKNLSFGIYSERIPEIMSDSNLGMLDLFKKGVEENNIELDNPEITLYMIIELVSSTCFSTIVKEKPLPIDEYKPYLYETIKKMINN